MGKTYGIKFLISGLENSAKSTVAASLPKDETLVLNYEYTKPYQFKMIYTTIYPHDYFDDIVKYKMINGKKVVDREATTKARDEAKGHSIVYTGVKGMKASIRAKILKFKKVKGKLPKYVVIDSSTGFYASMLNYVKHFNRNNKNTFATHTMNTDETNEFNAMIENLLLSNGIHVIVTAHVQYDEKTETYKTKAQGQFDKNGSWLGSCSEAIFLSIDGDDRVVHHSTLGLPCRTTMFDELPAMQTLESYNLTEHINKLEEALTENEEF